MNTSKATGKLNTADFVDQYPALFALYRELMRVTSDCIAAKRNAVNSWFAAEVKAAEFVCEAERDAAQHSYSLAVRPFADEYFAACQTSANELDATLSALRAERDAAQKPFVDACASAMLQLSTEFSRTADQCYLELGLPERVFDHERDGERYRERARAISDECAALKSPSEKIYSSKVYEAYLVHHKHLNVLLENHLSATTPDYQKRYDARAEAEANKEKLLSAIAERRQWWLNVILQNWMSQHKQWRLRLIENFLSSAVESILHSQLTGAIEAMKGSLLANQKLSESIDSMAKEMRRSIAGQLSSSS